MRWSVGRRPSEKNHPIGYEDCETYGYDPAKGSILWIKAPAFKQLLADNNMITTSGHYDFTKYFDNPADSMDADMLISALKVHMHWDRNILPGPGWILRSEPLKISGCLQES